jgi:hypothetical protein
LGEAGAFAEEAEGGGEGGGERCHKMSPFITVGQIYSGYEHSTADLAH